MNASTFRHPNVLNLPLDRDVYAPGVNDPKRLYGLPDDIEFCRSCVISNQRPSSVVEFKHKSDSKKPTIHFDENGVCDACRVAEDKRRTIDWAEREARMWELCDRFRRDDGRPDCIMSGSGGKDSFYASWLLKYKYNMHPLTVTWAPHMYTDWGWNNFQAWIHAGFDNYLMTPNGRVHRLLTRLATEVLLHPFQPFIFGQKNLAPKMAAQFDIPLVFYGENEAEFGNPRADNETSKRDARFFTTADDADIYLAGTSVSDLKEKYGLHAADLDPYMPINPNLTEEKGIEVHYVGFYEEWHPQGCYYHAVENGGFMPSPERTPGTYSKYNSIDDKVDDLHYYTTFIKFGIGRATYDAAQEIRNDEIERDEGVALVRRFDGEFPTRFESELWDYLSVKERELPAAFSQFEHPEMNREYFDRLCDRFRSPHIWSYDQGEWKLRKTVWQEAV